MQVFSCPGCGSPLYFENVQCSCGQDVWFDPDQQTFLGQAPSCANREQIGCNWVAEENGYCRSCNMTGTVPDTQAPENIELWATTELEKRWMLANLARWRWFTRDDPGLRPVFHLLSEQTSGGEAEVVMGHANSEITINVTEVKHEVRVTRRESLDELYRTMLGHLRHETAHFLFLRLSENEQFLNDFRALFGDERADYSQALQEHYANPKDPGQNYITSYATAHPHEDWAETTAHLLHLVDLLDSVSATGLTLPNGAPPGHDAYAEDNSEKLITYAVETSLALNHVNRALDLPDIYPFVLSPRMREKLQFVHHALKDRRIT